MAVQTAIDYSGRRVRLLEFDGSGRKLRVLAVQDVDLDVRAEPGEELEPDDARAAAIADAVKEGDFATDPSAMAFDAGHAMFREFDLPFTSEDQIAKVVRFESESHFPGDIDEIVLQHVVLRQTRDKSHLLVAAVRKDDLLDRLDILEESGLDPMFVDIDVFALFHALVGTGVADEHPRIAVVAAQESTASLMFLLEGKLYAVRSIRIGTHGVASAEEGDEAAGGERERRSAAGTAVASAAVVAERDLETARTHEYLTRLAREIRRTVSTLPDAGQPDALFVTGSGSRMKGFVEAVGGAFGATAQPLDLLSKVDHKLSARDVADFGPDIGVALGMAFKLNGLDVTQTDFRREEAAYTRKFDQVKTPLIVLSFLLFLTVAFLGLKEYMNVAKLKSEYVSMQDLGQRLLADLGMDEAAARAKWENVEFGPKRVQAVLAALGEIREQIKKDLGRGTKIPELQSALAVWIEAFVCIHDAEDPVGRLALDRLDIDVSSKTPTLKLSGEVEDQTHYQVLIDTLKRRPMFKDVQPGAVKQTTSGLRFTDIVIDLDMDKAPVEEKQPEPRPAETPPEEAAPETKPAEAG